MMFSKLFEGRYGFDAYSIMLLLFSLIFAQTNYLWVLSLVCLGYILFRAMSRDRNKRVQELMKFNHILARYFFFIHSVFTRIKRFFIFHKRRIQERKTSTITKCPQCSNILRLPKNKGRIEASCPVCRHSFVMKT